MRFDKLRRDDNDDEEEEEPGRFLPLLPLLDADTPPTEEPDRRFIRRGEWARPPPTPAVVAAAG